MSVSLNPLIDQGSLNKVLTHIIVPENPQLTVTASYMAKSQAVLTFDGPFTEQIGTATGIVNSPQPYVMAQVVISLLRSQAVSGLWIAQTQASAEIGPVTVYPDSDAFPPITLADCSIIEVDPGAFDGADPTTKVTVKGVFYTNAALWVGLS